jgi:trigger factor
VDHGKVTEGKDFVFSATVEVVPVVEPAGYKGIPVVRSSAAVTDEEVAGAIERLRESFAQYHPVEGRGAGASDLVEFAFTATAGGEAVDRNDSVAVLLSGGVPFGTDFEERMKGVVPGEARAFEVAYPGDFPNPKYAGKTVAFDVRVAGVREKKLPELDEEFAKNFGDLSGLGDLREKVRARLLAEAEERSRHRAEEDIRKGLLERNAFEVPSTLVSRQSAAMMQDTFRRLAAQGVDLKKVNMDVDKMSERLTPNAERMVRVSLLVDAIGKKEGIDVAFSEIDAEMKAMAEASGVAFLLEHAELREGAPE